MVEALIGRPRRGIDAVASRDRGDEDVGAAELEVDARLALLHAADDLGAEYALEPLRGRLRVRAAQVDVIPGVCRHFWFLPVSQQRVARRVGKGAGTRFQFGTAYRAPCPRVRDRSKSRKNAWARRTKGF